MSIKPGIYEKLSNQEYHTDPAVGSSGLRTFIECPALYYYHYLSGKSPHDESSAQSIGTHAHLMLLEPELFDQTYEVAPELNADGTKPLDNKRLKDWREFEAEVSNRGKTALLTKEYQQMCHMAAAVKHHSLASSFLLHSKREQSYFYQHASGVTMKGRPDILVEIAELGMCLVDYKTTGTELSCTAQSRHTFNMQHHVQAAHHIMAFEGATGETISRVFYIKQMQQAPYLVRVFELDVKTDVTLGKHVVENTLYEMAKCAESGIWPSYPEEIETLTAPAWTHYQSH